MKFVRFDETAFTIGKGPVRMSFAWDSIASARAAVAKGKPVMLLDIRDVEKVTIEPSRALAKRDAIVAYNRKSVGAEVASETEDFGYGAPQMVVTILHYVDHPETRAELA